MPSGSATYARKVLDSLGTSLMLVCPQFAIQSSTVLFSRDTNRQKAGRDANRSHLIGLFV